MSAERALVFDCAGTPLVGVLHPGREGARTGLVVVVGGPQYRIGSHRQFVHLARSLADAGVPALRFDSRGMGDSGGAFPGFEALDPDIRAAVDTLCAQAPGLERVVLWGLCDAASAILFYAHQDPRVAGIVLLNPWVRTEATHAQAQIRHYYAARLRDPAFWRRLASGGVNIGGALGGAAGALRTALGGGRRETGRAGPAAPAIDPALDLPDRMARGLALFGGPALLIMSGQDLTAHEFDDVAAARPAWSGLLGEARVTRRDLPAADHTFSRGDWTEQVAETTLSWLGQIAAARPDS